MSRRRYYGGKFSVRTSKPTRKANPRRGKSRSWSYRRFRLEHLEPRHLLSAAPLETSLPWNDDSSDPFADQGEMGGSGAAIEDLLLAAPFPLEDTFLLHSNPEATKVLYLDFNSHFTIGTDWNLGEDPDDPEDDLPSIYTPPYTLDPDHQFNDTELLNIQFIWERVAEDFRPFDIDVTTEEPPAGGITFDGPGDMNWGQRIAIGGSAGDWFDDSGGVGGVAYGSFGSPVDVPAFAFSASVGNGEKNVAEVISHESGHTMGLGHDGADPPFGDLQEYYPGHGAGPTGWAPIMGVGYDQILSQWSIGDYPYANMMQDDLSIITSENGFDYRPDDHGNDFSTASILEFDQVNFFGEGIVEENTDVDWFKVYLDVESLVLDINPFHRGPNLDILAKLYMVEDGVAVEIAESNPIDGLNATFSINTSDPEALQLESGTYYLSVEGTGKPHTTDFGYSDYGSLGYYSIVGTRTSFLQSLVGVDFDVLGGLPPENWTSFSGSAGPAVLSDLQNELGIVTPYNLSISSSKTAFPVVAGAANPSSVVVHPNSLAEIGGGLADSNVEWSFVWSDLKPLSVYEVYVFGLSNLAVENDVLIEGLDSLEFTQTLSANDLYLNIDPGDDERQLIHYARTFTADEEGRITITVANPDGEAGIGGLAIREGTLGSISGQKWHDENGDGVKQFEEVGLEGWRIFIDDNENGIWEEEFINTVHSGDVPQPLPDPIPNQPLVPVKSTLLYQGSRIVLDLDVTVNITHNFIRDLDVFLISPEGTRVELFTDVGGISDNFHDTVLDDEAVDEEEVPKLIADGTGPFTGTYRPEGMLSDFDGEDPRGVWTLEVYDDAILNNIGVLHNWSLTITGQELSTITDAEGNYIFEEQRPGVFHVAESLVDQEGWVPTFTSPPVTLTSGAKVKDINFGNWIPDELPGAIEGQKWNDLNGDGVQDAGEEGLEGWTVFVDVNGNGILDPPMTVTVSSADLPEPDPEDPDAEIYPREITDFSTVISTLSFDGVTSVRDVNVTLDITHTFAADLEVYLISPSQTQVKLFAGVGSQYNDFQNTSLDDESDTWVFDSAAPFAGTFRPEETLSDFDGEDPNGVWQLLIRDTTFGDEGTLNSWSITILAEEASDVTDENGNYSLGELDPGIYNIFEVMQPGWEQTYPLLTEEIPYWEVEVISNQTVTGRNFANRFVGIEGDYNDDGLVNAADYVFWRDRVGAGGAGGGDGSGNGTVGQEDYDMWQANFGAANPSGAGAGEALAAATSSDDSTSEPLVAAFSASGDSASSSATLVSDVGGPGMRAFGNRGAAERPTNAAPDGDRADSALLAWLAGLGEDERPGRPERTRFDWDFAGERERSERSDNFAAAIDSAFENLGV